MAKYVNVYAGRLNFLSGSRSETEQYLKELTSARGHLLKENEFAWRFGGIHLAGQSITGKFGKEKLIKNMTQFDERRNDFVEKPTRKGEAFYSNFCIFLNENIILFERKFGVGHIEFVKAFSAVYNKAHGRGNLEVELLKDKEEILAIMERADMVTSIEFSIKPTNPDAGEESRKVDDMLKEIRAKKSGMSFSNNEEGIDYKKKGSIVSSAIALCNRGYGKYNVKTKKGEEEVRIESIKKLIKEHTKAPETGKELEFFASIWRKIKRRLE